MSELDELKIKLLRSECNRKWEQLEHVKPRIEKLGGDVSAVSREQQIYEDILDLIR